MQAVRIHEHGDEEVLQVDEIERPDPADDELLVTVKAVGVNPVDTYFREGTYTPIGLPFTPGCDLAGVVTEVGSGVEEFEAGDRVFATGIGNGSYQGAYAEYAVVPTDRVVRVPPGVDLTQAGAAGIVAATAWYALVVHAAIAPAEHCLIHGGSGGVGHVAVQIAAAVSAHPVATASSDYHDRVQELGAESVLDYARDDLVDAVLEATDGGVDVVLDQRMDDYLQLDADVANPRGRIVGIGQNQPDPGFTDIGDVRSKDLEYHFVSMFNTRDISKLLAGVVDLMEAGKLSIEVARTYDLEDAAEAQRAVREDSYLGKLVIVP